MESPDRGDRHLLFGCGEMTAPGSINGMFVFYSCASIDGSYGMAGLEYGVERDGEIWAAMTNRT